VAPAGVVRWGEKPSPPPAADGTTGIYVVSLSDRFDSTSDAIADPPISSEAVSEIVSLRPELTLDGGRPTTEALAERLSAFWFPDEVVLYIGLAGPRKSRPARGEVANRVGEYYATPLGANGPHAGGWFLKTLTCLGDLHVHYGYCDDVVNAERSGISRFSESVSPKTRRRLHDPDRLMPFANLEFPKGNRKAHGIRGAKQPKRKKQPFARQTDERRLG